MVMLGMVILARINRGELYQSCFIFSFNQKKPHAERPRRRGMNPGLNWDSLRVYILFQYCAITNGSGWTCSVTINRRKNKVVID